MTPWTAAGQASLSFMISQSLLKFMFFELVMLSNHIIPRPPHLLLPSAFSSIRVFSLELALHIRWSKDWSFSFSISPSSEYSGLISFRINLFDPLTVQGTFKLDFSSSTIQKHQFLGVQPSLCPTLTSIHDYWKNRSFDSMDLCQQSDVFAF